MNGKSNWTKNTPVSDQGLSNLRRNLDYKFVFDELKLTNIGIVNKANIVISKLYWSTIKWMKSKIVSKWIEKIKLQETSRRRRKSDQSFDFFSALRKSIFSALLPNCDFSWKKNSSSFLFVLPRIRLKSHCHLANNSSRTPF